MKSSLKHSTIEAQYIVDKKGRKTAVILDIKVFKKLLEEVEDLYLGKLAQSALDEDSEYITHADVIKALSKEK
jgi:hypothetical protein